MANQAVLCPGCRRQGTTTVLARQVPEGDGTALLIKPRAAKICKSLGGEGFVIKVRCQRCHGVFALPVRVADLGGKDG